MTSSFFCFFSLLHTLQSSFTAGGDIIQLSSSSKDLSKCPVDYSLIQFPTRGLALQYMYPGVLLQFPGAPCEDCRVAQIFPFFQIEIRD